MIAIFVSLCWGHDWLVSDKIKEVCWVFIFIAINLLLALQWKIKNSTYLVNDDDLYDETDQ